MTCTLPGYLVYRLQDKIEKRTGIKLSYNDLIVPLSQSLLELSRDMNINEFIELPDGKILIKR